MTARELSEQYGTFDLMKAWMLRCGVSENIAEDICLEFEIEAERALDACVEHKREIAESIAIYDSIREIIHQITNEKPNETTVWDIGDLATKNKIKTYDELYKLVSDYVDR